jgi:hypothetical protein
MSLEPNRVGQMLLEMEAANIRARLTAAGAEA